MNLGRSIGIDYEYVEQISEELQCVICKEIYERPVMLVQCQHQFCQDCLECWLKETLTCPICRREVSLETFPYIFIDLPQLRNRPIQCLHCGQSDLREQQWHEHDRFCRMLAPIIDELRSVKNRQVQLNQTLDLIETELASLLQSIKPRPEK